MKIAIIGASGMVGEALLRVLADRDFPVSSLELYASPRSAGKVVVFKGKEYIVKALDETIADAPSFEVAFFAAGGSISAKYAKMLADKNVLVIDNSSHFRMDADVPLVVPEVNPSDAKNHKGIIANPNCSTIQAVVAIAPLHQVFKAKRVIYTTFQAVSGAGTNGIVDLENTLKGKEKAHFAHAIAHNAIPHIDAFSDEGYTKEELKMVNETRKILNAPELAITATCVRVPIFNGHSVSINIEFENKFEIDRVVQILSQGDGIIVEDDVANNIYPMPINASGRDEVFVGRIRRDLSKPNALNMWVVADNVRKGAATNAIQIAQLFI